MAARCSSGIFLISALFVACANDPVDGGIADCEYKFTNKQMIERFKDVMVNEVKDLEIYESDEAVFEVRKKNCNYYVKFTLKSAPINGGSLVIFDKSAEVVHSGWR